MSKLNLKTAEERAAEIRAQSAEVEAANAAKAAEKQAELDAPKAKAAEPAEEKVDYTALARMEEERAAKLKAQVDALQAEMDPTVHKAASETKPYVRLDDILNHPERSAQETLAALHDAIRKGREEAEPVPHQWPSDMSHMTPSQKAKTLAEMEAGKRASERAEAAQAQNRKIRDAEKARLDHQTLQLEQLKAKLAEAEATISVLRHNPVNGKDAFPTVSKVSSANL